MLERLGQIYPFLILAGATIAGVLWHLRRQARDRVKVALDLVHLNEKMGFDLFPFLESGAQRLTTAGFCGLAWEVDWFGSVRRGSAGAQSAPGSETWERHLTAPDINLRLILLPGRLTGERRIFAEFLAQAFVLLLQTDLWIKAGGIASALSGFHRLTLFLGHDVKNLAQFIQIAGDQIENLRPDDEQVFLAYLRTALPLFRERGERIIKALTTDQPTNGSPSAQDLVPTLEKLAAAHGLAVEISGQGTAWLPRPDLDGILDNLLGNHARHAVGFSLAIDVRNTADWVEIAITSGPATDTNLLRLFEPFWTGSDQGLGLGLYQARQLARNSGGNLGAAVGPDGRLRFELRLPAAR